MTTESLSPPTGQRASETTLRVPGPIGDDSPAVGLHEGVPEDKYRAWPCLNQSLLKLGIPGKGSPLHIRAELVSPRESTKAMDEGTALHALVLQPERVDELVFIPGFLQGQSRPDKRTNAGKLWWAEIEKAANGRVIIDPHEWDRVRRMADALLAHPISGPMLRNSAGLREVAAVWDDEQYPLRCKVRIDLLVPGVFAIDFKKTTKASEDAFLRSIRDYGYHCQAAWNEDGFNAVTGERTDLTLAAVEDQYPFAVHCFCPSPRAVELGRAQLRASLDGYAKAIRSNCWPSYNDDSLTPFEMPTWEYARWNIKQ